MIGKRFLAVVVIGLTADSFAAAQSELPPKVAADLKLLDQTVRFGKPYRDTSQVIDRLEINDGLAGAAEVLVAILADANKRGGRLNRAQWSGVYYSFVTIRSKGEEQLPILIPMLKSPNTQVRSTTARILSLIGKKAKPAVPQLKPLLKDTDDDVALRAAEALWQIDRQIDIALPVFIGALKSPDSGVRLEAVRILESIGPLAAPAAPALITLVDHADATKFPGIDIQTTAGSALRNIGPVALPELIRRLKRPNPPIVVVRLLGKYGGQQPNAIGLLKDLLDSMDDPLAITAAISLAQLGHSKESAPVLIAGFRNEETRSLASTGLTHLGPEAKAVVPELNELSANRGMTSGGSVPAKHSGILPETKKHYTNCSI